MAASTASSAATADARASSRASASSGRPTGASVALRSDLGSEQRSGLLAAKLRALVASHWGEGDRRTDQFPDGAALRSGGAGWVLLDDDGAARRLGAAMAWSHRHRLDDLHVVVDEADTAAVLARRASSFSTSPSVWRADGRALVAARPAPPPVSQTPPPTAELYAALLAEAGLEVVVEDGVVRGEVLGLEVARVVAGSDGGAHLEAGVGRFDREAFALLHGDLGDADGIAHVTEVVRKLRRPGVDPHPLNRLAPERWLRALVVATPTVVGAATLESAEPALVRPNLTTPWPAPAVGTDADGAPLVVVCSTGVDLDLVPSAADDRLVHRPDARLVLALPRRDVLPFTRTLAAALRSPADIVELADDWRREVSAC